MKVEVRNNNVEQALRILKRKTQKEGTIRIAREKEFYEKPTAKRQRKKKSVQKTFNFFIKVFNSRLKGIHDTKDIYLYYVSC